MRDPVLTLNLSLSSTLAPVAHAFVQHSQLPTAEAVVQVEGTLIYVGYAITSANGRGVRGADILPTAGGAVIGGDAGDHE
ncbi:hypothetical protein ON010_g9366 [Phytophthora cinnamomi]|nr:hypothetical protein ON010_g9366 [Phytophthora cinnamomi]